MNAGKTTDLIIKAFTYENEEIPIIIFTSVIDTRSGIDKIKSKMGPEKGAISIKDNDDLYQKVSDVQKKIGCVFVDEIQFFTVKQIWQLFDITHKLQIPVVCYGLRVDFMGNPFPASAQLMAIANKVEELWNKCWCHKKAIMNARIINGKVVYKGEQVMIEGKVEYKSLCSEHWLSGQYQKNKGGLQYTSWYYRMFFCKSSNQ